MTSDEQNVLVVGGAEGAVTTLTSGGAAVGIAVTPGAPGVAQVAGTNTLVGDSVLRVTLTCTDAAGGSVEHWFDIAVTDEPPVVVNGIPNMLVASGRPMELVVPADTFADDVTPVELLQVTGNVRVVDRSVHRR